MVDIKGCLYKHLSDYTGGSVFFTQYLECSRVYFLHHGSIMCSCVASGCNFDRYVHGEFGIQPCLPSV